MSLRSAFCAESTGGNLAHLESFLEFLRQRMSAPDCEEAEHLLHVACCPTHAARHHGERGLPSPPPPPPAISAASLPRRSARG